MAQIYHCYIQSLAQKEEELASILYLKKRGQICFYDLESDVFYTPDLNRIDLRGKIIIPHNYIDEENKLIKKIIERGGIIPEGINREIEVTNWLDFYKPKRKIYKIKAKELINLNILQKIEKTYGKEIFFKTLKKSYSDIVKIDDLKNPQTIINIALQRHLDETFIISEFVNIIKDDIGRKEYRIFVFENQILSIFRHTEIFLHKIDKFVYERAKEIVEELKNKGFPSSYVMDLFEYIDKYGNKEIDVVEFNGFHASGRYLYNSIDHLPTDDMLHEKITNIALEKRGLVHFCLIPDKKYEDYVSMFCSSKYCDEPGTFSNDLKKLHESNNILTFDNKFDLGRCVSDNVAGEILNCPDTQKKSNIMSEIVKKLVEMQKNLKEKNFSKIYH